MRNKFHIGLPTLVLFFICTVLSAQETHHSQRLLDYYSMALKELSNPKGMKMLDTLQRMAEEEGNMRMYLIAETKRIDYYITDKNAEDSVIYYVNSCKALSDKYNQPTYYFFAWNRLITFYIRDRKYLTALSELSSFQKEALERKDLDGELLSHILLARVYYSRDLPEQAWDEICALMKLIKKEKYYDFYNLYYAYYLGFMSLNSMESVPNEQLEEYLLDASQHITGPNRHYLTLIEAYYYLKIGKNEEAKMSIDSLSAAPEISQTAINELHVGYAVSSGDYADALEYIKQAEASYTWSRARQIVKLDIMHELGYCDSIYPVAKVLMDSLRRGYRRQLLADTEEQSQLLKVGQINAEKDRIEMEARGRRLNYLFVMSFCLLVFIIIITWMYFKVKKDNQFKNDFIHHVSHEIRTPVNIIMGYVTVLSQECQYNKELKGYCDIMIENSRALSSMISNAGDLTLFSSDSTKKFVKKKLNIAVCCQKAINDERMRTSSDIPVDFIKEEDAPESINTCEAKLNRILRSLIDNAYKFTKTGHISVSVTGRKHKILISVTDTGIGIPPHMVKTIFKPYVKVDEFASGLGLGLTLARMYARQLGGDLALDTSYTQGSRFVVTLPA